MVLNGNGKFIYSFPFSESVESGYDRNKTRRIGPCPCGVRMKYFSFFLFMIVKLLKSIKLLAIKLGLDAFKAPILHGLSENLFYPPPPPLPSYLKIGK